MLNLSTGPGRRRNEPTSPSRAIGSPRSVRIAPASGARVIDANGLTLAPGFIDIHSHSDYHLLLQPTADSAVRQGVTLEIGGNCGYAAAPIWGPWCAERAALYRDLYSLDHTWNGVSAYFSRLEAAGISENFGLLIGHNTLRGSVMGGANRAPSEAELEAMIDGARQGMAEGALGLSTGLIYAPACFSSPDELVAIAAAVREAGGILTCHMRSEGDRLLEAIVEILDVAERASISLQISHPQDLRRAQLAEAHGGVSTDRRVTSTRS
ncbi:MAG: amidohydrolase family protein [Candidatus Methylomirabilis sp.]|nr:amidohydrolase family protein [Candidatus Methylomirabilis sp.]